MDGEPRVKIALQKSGRLADSSFDLLTRCGLKFARSKDRLFCYGENMPIDLLLVRDDDIPGLIHDGVCDLGIVGENVAMESAFSKGNGSLSQVRRLDFGGCRLSIAIPEAQSYERLQDLSDQRLATSYPGLLADYLKRHDVNAQIVELSGSVEIAPSIGTADAICDLVSTGGTLRANHLREVEVVLESQAGLYLGAAPLCEDKQAQVDRLLRRVDGVLQVKESKYVMLHAPRESLAEIRSLLPGAESPTVLPLEGNDSKVAIHAVCRETVFWEHLEALKAAGASAVLVLPVEKMLA